MHSLHLSSILESYSWKEYNWVLSSIFTKLQLQIKASLTHSSMKIAGVLKKRKMINNYDKTGVSYQQILTQSIGGV